jgi:hypothetical protein
MLRGCIYVNLMKQHGISEGNGRFVLVPSATIYIPLSTGVDISLVFGVAILVKQRNELCYVISGGIGKGTSDV